jgi:hypothetical protein
MSTAFKRFDKASAEFVAATEFELNDISARGFFIEEVLVERRRTREGLRTGEVLLSLLILWCRKRDSNPRPHHYE